jgi:hypothetical protein
VATLEERLRLVVDATTGAAEASFGRLTSSAEQSARASDAVSTSVAGAANAVAQARAKEADAAGKLSVAEAKLAEARARYGENSSQVVAAEERVAAAQRQVQIASSNTATALEQQETAQRAATDAADKGAPASERAGRGAQRMSDEVKGLRDTVVGLVAGVSLADWVSESVGGFLDGARSAAALAVSMNASTEEAGRFLGLVGQYGLELDDLIEIQAEFAGKTRDGLTQLGTELQHNADGTVNWTNTLVDTLAQLQKVPDATERNRLGFSMFGEEGYKQLSRLLTSGKSVEEAIAAIGTPFTDEDVEATREFDAVMTDLKASGGAVGRELGSVLVPIMTTVLEVFGDVGDVIGAIPGPIGVAALAAVGLGVAQRFAGTEGGWLAGQLAGVSASLAVYRAEASLAIASNGLLGASMGLARGAASGFLSMLGGPFGIALLAAGATYYFMSDGADAFRESSKKAAAELATAEKQYGASAASAEEMGKRLAAEAGFWENLAASRRGANTALEDGNGAAGAVDAASGGALTTLISLADAFSGNEVAAQGFANEIDRARDELEGLEEQQAVTQITTKTLNDLVAEGTTGGREFADAVQAAADAQADESRTTDIAKAAIDAYNATTRDAVQTTLDLYSAQLGQRDGLIGVQQAFYELSTTVDDAETPWNEITEATNRAIESTISYAGTAADAAVEAARAAGAVLDPLTEAQVRADATIAALRESLNDPNMTADARTQIETLIGQLDAAKSNSDITALLTLTGGPEVAGELDEATGDRETTVTVESRNGPAVVAYLDRITNAERLALIRVESRGGPAVDAYLDGLAHERLAIIRVETRGGPDVDRYLDSLTTTRTAIIEARGRGGAGVAGSGLYGAPGLASVGTGASRVALGDITLDLELRGVVDRGQLTKAEQGRVAVEGLRAYSQRNGAGWLRELM